MAQTLEREYTDLRLAPPDWYIRLALQADLSLYEAEALWLYYCDASRYEIGVVLNNRGEQSASRAILRAQRKIAAHEPVTVDANGELLSALRERLIREAHEVLACVRNELGKRGSGPAPGERMPKVREVTAEDLAEEKLQKLIGNN
jgi:hypothetical protein